MIPPYAPHVAFCPVRVVIPSVNSKQPAGQQAITQGMGPRGISRVVNQGLARQYRQGFLPWTVARDGRFCHFGHPDPTWRTRGALMPGPQREPGWVRAPGSSYSKGIGSVASSLPLARPDEGSILEFSELISVWAETAHFQRPTPRGQWRGHISGSERSWDLLL